jgi:hypothetical protein
MNGAPTECCSGQDCAPVDRIEIVAGGIYYAGMAVSKVPASMMIVTTKHGSVAVPPNFPQRLSPDGRACACRARRR